MQNNSSQDTVRVYQVVKLPHSLLWSGVTPFGSGPTEEVVDSLLCGNQLLYITVKLFKMSNNNNTVHDLAAVPFPSKSLESDKNEPKHTADVNACSFFVMILEDGCTHKSLFQACIPVMAVTRPHNSN